VSSNVILNSEYKPCMECATRESPKPVMVGRKLGIKVTKKSTGQLIGYLHLNCRDVWVEKNGSHDLSLETV